MLWGCKKGARNKRQSIKLQISAEKEKESSRRERKGAAMFSFLKDSQLGPTPFLLLLLASPLYASTLTHTHPYSKEHLMKKKLRQVRMWVSRTITNKCTDGKRK